MLHPVNRFSKYSPKLFTSQSIDGIQLLSKNQCHCNFLQLPYFLYHDISRGTKTQVLYIGLAATEFRTKLRASFNLYYSEVYR